ncbi:MAG TPA: DUF6113 family protein [Sporichthyaceae bacterium]|nr:DUF6113 family protein [Sporichthyaceae bacterium]
MKRPTPPPTARTRPLALFGKSEGVADWVARRGVPRVIGVSAGLFLLGFVVGVAGAFEHAEKAPLGLIVSLLAEGSVVFAAGVHARCRFGAGLPAAAWVLSVLIGIDQRPEGDLLIPADHLGYAYLVGGLVLLGLLTLLPYGGSLVPDR